MQKDKKQKITSLQDLADIAGVSRATASRALNDSPMISEKTRHRLQSLAAEHGYSINRQARDLRLQKKSVIAVVFMLDIKSHQHMSDPFFLDMFGGIADAVADHEYDLLLAHSPVVDVLDLDVRRVVGQSDGVIFIGQGEQHEQLNQFAHQHKNMVVWGFPVAGKNYITVSGDNKTGGYAATSHLIENGRKRIAFFGPTNNPEVQARYQGYLQALSEHGLEADPALKVDIPFEMNQAHEVIAALLDTGVDFDGVMCSSDVIALASVSTFHELGLRVPRDISVVGYDDISLAGYSNPPLTTVRQNIRHAGRILVESLLGLIKGEDIPDTTLTSELIVRKSSIRKPVVK